MKLLLISASLCLLSLSLSGQIHTSTGPQSPPLPIGAPGTTEQDWAEGTWSNDLPELQIKPIWKHLKGFNK